MMNKLIARLFIFLSCFLALQIANAQEHEVPLKENIALKNYKRPSSFHLTASVFLAEIQA